MYSILLAIAAAALAFTAIALTMGPVTATIPAVLVFGIVIIVVMRRVSTRVQASMAPLQTVLQAGKVDEAEALLVDIQQRYGKWMPLLHGQIEAQRGMLYYVRAQFDEALPRLQAGKWRNWIAQGCIGCIQLRNGDKDTAFATLAKASKTGSKEPLAWILRTVLLSRDGRQDEALSAISEGLVAIPGNKQLTDLKNRIANKQRIETARFGQGWFQFFPEELAQRMRAQQNPGNTPFGGGFRSPRSSKQQRRGR